MRRWLLRILLVVIVGFLAIQLVPYGRSHTNPAVAGEPAWDTPRTRELAKAACFDCHSNETAWPWYTNVAPISWITQRHVDEGREKLNFSAWGQGEQETEHAARLIRNGEMPPWDYRLMHPEANLSDADKQALIDGITATFGAGEGGEGGGGESGENGEQEGGEEGE